MSDTTDIALALDTQSAQTPIACLLSSDEQAKRKVDVSDLLKQAQQVRELADGYEFSYEASEEWIRELSACILFERVCCPFFTFELVFEPELGPLWLRLRGPGEVKEFVKSALLPPSS